MRTIWEFMKAVWHVNDMIDRVRKLETELRELSKTLESQAAPFRLWREDFNEQAERVAVLAVHRVCRETVIEVLTDREVLSDWDSQGNFVETEVRYTDTQDMMAAATAKRVAESGEALDIIAESLNRKQVGK